MEVLLGAVRGLMGLLLGPDRGRGERCGRAGEQEGEEEEEGDEEKEQCSMQGGGRGAGGMKKKGSGRGRRTMGQAGAAMGD